MPPEGPTRDRFRRREPAKATPNESKAREIKIITMITNSTKLHLTRAKKEMKPITPTTT